MKIAVIGTKGLPPAQGGIEHYCAEVYPRMVAQGHEVDLFSRNRWTQTPWYQSHQFQGVRVISLPCPGKRGFDAFISSGLGALACIGKSYDIIHFHALGPSIFCGLPRLTTTAKVIVSCQGLDWKRGKWGRFSSRLIWLGEQAAVRFSHQMIAVSEDLAGYFQTNYGLEALYIPNGPAGYQASDPSFTFAKSLGLEPQKYLIFLGRLVPEKCPDLLIQAFQQLMPSGWKLAVVGGSSDASDYQRYLRQLASGNPNIVFTGELKGQYLAEVVRGAGLFVLPSKLEGLPLAMLESMQEGIPVIASDISPHRQLVGTSRGRLFQVENVEHCMQELDWAIQHPQAMQTMAQQAQKYVRTHYSWDEITAATLRLYTSLLSSPEPQVDSVGEYAMRK